MAMAEGERNRPPTPGLRCPYLFCACILPSIEAPGPPTHPPTLSLTKKNDILLEKISDFRCFFVGKKYTRYIYHYGRKRKDWLIFIIVSQRSLCYRPEQHFVFLGVSLNILQNSPDTPTDTRDTRRARTLVVLIGVEEFPIPSRRPRREGAAAHGVLSAVAVLHSDGGPRHKLLEHNAHLQYQVHMYDNTYHETRRDQT